MRIIKYQQTLVCLLISTPAACAASPRGIWRSQIRNDALASTINILFGKILICVKSFFLLNIFY